MNKRYFVSFPLTVDADAEKIKKQVLIWLRRFSTCCFLDNSDYPAKGEHYECLAAAGESARITLKNGDAFPSLRRFSAEQQDWLFGHFCFSLKEETDGIADGLPENIAFPDGFFFVPETVLYIDRTHLHIGCLSMGESAPDEMRPGAVYREILLAEPPPAPVHNPIVIRERMSRAEYLAAVRQLLRHIGRGDCYEINYCQEFFADDAKIDPFRVFGQLSAVSPAPFAAFYRLDDRYLLCASPERYLRREGSRVFSQPIKGTAPRFPKDPVADASSRQALTESVKDQTENVMIADLVRNDLSRFCLPDSVRVDELFGIYSFAQVHQMITTISGRVKTGLNWTDMIEASFPMGSMTGAPKRRVLELIGQYEKTKRGLFSGAVGYVKPDGDFDFNVVIRSLLYDESAGRLSWFAGSGITAASNPEAEYAECLVKIAAIKEVLNPA